MSSSSAAKPLDLIVIGAGLTGLIAARESAERGMNVSLVEARERVGGQIWTIPHPETGQLIALGAEWLNLERMPLIQAEFRRYNITPEHLPFHDQYLLHDWDGVKSQLGRLEDVLKTLQSDGLFQTALGKMERDVSFLQVDSG
eukprot:CAMPEP_0173266926 /NCGR_PEP_ID=MMETSP1142-20121109/29474_1 /TAXON_ID=483371 /ORGANISM="non described non described, Strain CCMP2298" /LENGTH=142 /DNA_ID=CAMNT_0014202975 /DNA_START=83 /DNA_END=508 /DNA_ORIENTATION=+